MKVKICGVTHPADAEFACNVGADYIGMLFSDRSKRKISASLAKEIVDAAKQKGAEPVGVFVDETADEITAICEYTGIRTIQLHGHTSQQAVGILMNHFSIIFAIGADKQMSKLHPSLIPLYDNKEGGTGIAFDWKAFTPPSHGTWILAGGLNPANVGEAIKLLKPSGVDVSTGVEYPHQLRKDPLLVESFLQTAKQIERTA